MSVQVYDNAGGNTLYESADAVHMDGLQALWVQKADGETVAVYAPGKWINADIKGDA